MGQAQAVAGYYITPEEYLAGEAVAEQRHEYVAGVVYAMSGTSLGQGRIVANISGLLRDQLRGRRCEAFATEIKVGIRRGQGQYYYYPDIVVDCGSQPDDSYFADEPRVIFEVLSESTERTDRMEKLVNYQALAALDVYVLVDQVRMAVMVYRRTNGDWTSELLTGADDVLELPTIECRLLLRTIYERTRLLA